jgi:hypothetical protein
MKTRSKHIYRIVAGLTLISLISCGKDESKRSGASDQVLTQVEDDQGVYRAVLKPINVTVAGEISGTVEIKIQGDEVVVESNVANASSGVKYLQNIMAKRKCPGTENDTNGDTFIDISESLYSTGPVLIPLDSDLSSQLDGITYGPISNSAGSYVYRRSTTLSNITSDLLAPDPDPTDFVVKLPSSHRLNLSGRVVVVQGVRGSLPDTVAGLGELFPNQALPIACGELVRIIEENE